ncbi:MAG TPA: hypothetical protein DCS07_17760 [Bdellovibrionales bacterium]|nr:MAG: hypothetical protein A2Z97_00810 [Bdellovibrionales bacterium GWB1_52_6]OFZ05198.1 MAG: hypothetical protein A2X97_10420 [Bdellovibrionales bacterium GWA1_52_35]HAR44448.1 hypothetical protein [Bdellovibrionales bacterium]HCM38671.1 hypothetical protein [Bdellovibrionales bacterium]
MQRSKLFIITVLVLTGFGQSASALSKKKLAVDQLHHTLAAPLKLKYGKHAKPLALSHEYFLSHPAPDFWALSPYYAGQQTDSSCSAASAVMVLNAVRREMNLLATDELITEAALLKHPELSAWKQAVGPGGSGVTLDQLKSYFSAALKAYSIENFELEVFHVNDQTPKALKALRSALVQNEKRGLDFIIANFLQGTLTGDAAIGHMAPVGAYDAAKKRVLIMDPDRRWYEPYWVPENVFLAGMATRDPVSGFTRGFLRVRLSKKKLK